ncbi:protein HEG homolog 1-like isoform X2 [Pelobates fuscus]|uniref:protein HEG homolog 1-like isoform X2 n=1 Tax=Pelobates fuscus TaxID=191477 RepID=UPI002FE4CD75
MFLGAASRLCWCPQLIITYLLCLSQLLLAQKEPHVDSMMSEASISQVTSERNPWTFNNSSGIEGAIQSTPTSPLTTEPLTEPHVDSTMSGSYISQVTSERNPGTFNNSSVIEGAIQSTPTYPLTTEPITARTFPARISLSGLRLNQDLSEEEMLDMKMAWTSDRVKTVFHAGLGSIDGYLSTSIQQLDLQGGHMVVLHYFSTLFPVTEQILQDALTQSATLCMEADYSCVLSTDSYQGFSLCEFGLCDPPVSTSECQNGLIFCVCREGYYKSHPWDHSCKACGSGFQWKDGDCLRCPFGFGGFNCEDSFLLAVVVESCVISVIFPMLVVLLFHYIRGKKKPAKPFIADSIIVHVPSDQQVFTLPRAQLSWRSNWEWEQPPLGRETAHPDKDPVLEPARIQLKTFGESSRSHIWNPSHGSHNPSFISDN